MRLTTRLRSKTIIFITNVLPLVTVMLSQQVEARVVDEERPASSGKTIAIALDDSIDPHLLPPMGPEFVTTPPAESRPTAAKLRPQLLAKPNMVKSSAFQAAYLQAFEILSGENSCSRFFGGQSAAHVLNELAQRIKLVSLHKNNASRMEGQVTIVRNLAFEVTYRLFEKTGLNRNGAFFKAHTFPNDPLLPFVGRFGPNTEEARVAILLHELGHLVRTSENKWLLPDDGRNVELSLKNTERVLEACADDIKAGVRKKEN